ncbi:50S ribosomal protein L29 [Seleniivibrio woodruffii]|uniref:Large ribosomal subunit protein uL29 n=1 Tax=Seleniivibrio woodruffii TaxID=1078050 RepID=A0A4R1KCF8_9BACT|nr:50S ribosomal protein L29 [Seleniivibrio woodruffii]TCK62216.1 large subunit ribosomal protein L29 [Seleniivibrio woodruffii]TVZ34666.1 large subunit ribosomal protein L29 [Seleniivibrio woodruffii]
MKAAELKALSVAELKAKELELSENIFRMKFKLATGDIEDSSLIRKAKKDIARIQTILNEKSTEGK